MIKVYAVAIVLATTVLSCGEKCDCRDFVSHKPCDTVYVADRKVENKLRKELKECEEHSDRLDTNLKRAIEMLEARPN